MPRDQKVLAHDPEKPHEFGPDTAIHHRLYSCAFCGKSGEGTHLFTWLDRCRSDVDICRACIRLALYRMAEIPEAQS